MNMQPFPGVFLYDVCTIEATCDCDAHCGDTIRQITARLENGKPVAIMEDWRGYHLAIGSRNMLGKFNYTPPIDRTQIIRALWEAMR